MVMAAAMQHHGDTVGSRGEYEQLASMHDPRYPTRGIDQLAHDHTQDLWGLHRPTTKARQVYLKTHCYSRHCEPCFSVAAGYVVDHGK